MPVSLFVTPATAWKHSPCRGAWEAARNHFFGHRGVEWDRRISLAELLDVLSVYDVLWLADRALDDESKPHLVELKAAFRAWVVERFPDEPMSATYPQFHAWWCAVTGPDGLHRSLTLYSDMARVLATGSVETFTPEGKAEMELQRQKLKTLLG